MCESFLKLNTDNDEADFLALRHPNAFILLYFIARRARRKSGMADGLSIGQCHIGDYKSYGLTESEYRTAKKILCDRKIIKILETCRNRKKSTTGVTTYGTLIELLDSKVWDINSKMNDDRNDDRIATGSRPVDEEQDRERKRKKEKENITTPTPSFSVPSKIKFREFVELTQQEHDSLLAKNGAEFLSLMLDTLDAYKGSSGKKYDSDFHTMKQGGWVVNRVKKDLQEQKNANEKINKSSPGRQSSLNLQPSTEKFQPGRVLRGSNEGSVSEGGSHE